MGNPAGPSVLSRSQRLQMCIWFAEMYEPTQVVGMLKEKYGIDYTQQSASYFRRSSNNVKLIAWFRKRFKQDVSRIPIARKEVRIQKYMKIYNKAMSSSLKSRNQFGEIYEMKLGEARAALEGARIEMEGDKSKPQIQIVNIVNALHNEAQKVKNDRQPKFKRHQSSESSDVAELLEDTAPSIL